MQLKATPNAVVLQEIRDGQISGVTGSEFLELVRKARTFLASKRLRKGDRCGILAANSIRWIALDLAAIAEGFIVVPLYSRQAPAELIAMMIDSTPSLVCCGDATLRAGVEQAWPQAPPRFLFDEIFAGVEGVPLDRPQVRDEDPVTIIYTSGTSGESKGVVLTAANVGFMLGCTSARLDQLMGGRTGQDRIFHYLPFNFCASWIAVLSFMLRGSLVTLNTDLTKIPNDMPAVAPHYFLNVPQLLERMRRAVDEQIATKGGVVLVVYSRAKADWARNGNGFWLWLANAAIFPAIRKKMAGANLRALICGSAPLTPETQDYFRMLGIPVLQVYGLTETTGICTMDDPQNPVPGRVGPTIAGIEMKLGENEEIIVRGPNVFPGYWNRPQQTAEVLKDGWFHTGDQGEIEATGTWRIVGRIKNLIVLGSGHKIAPETIEEEIARQLPTAQQVVIVGNGRGYLSAIVTGAVDREQVQSALDEVNPHLPHYKQVRAFCLRPEPFSIENGMLTANGKLKRDLISSRMKDDIENMYQVRQAV
ncbi:MAG TPA: AMP-binding protein [Candidatus Sulfotelmatobacter sp.]|nr:AMP-binding protein [Candidatus Sulfotelmatobacter sp.]HEV2468637.1 AMP-binding protein [Candidatus Sulfotelmatobacter sp.]